MRITIGGLPGSGKTTLAKKLAEKLNINFYSMGDLRRQMAKEIGMTIDQLNKLGEKDPYTDKKVDEQQKTLGEKEDNFVIESRLGFYYLPSDTIKIFLTADPKIRAKRIMSNAREEEKYKSLEEAVKKIDKRTKSDIKRYKKYYPEIKTSCYDILNYDFVINTTKLTIDEVIDVAYSLVKCK